MITRGAKAFSPPTAIAAIAGVCGGGGYVYLLPEEKEKILYLCLSNVHVKALVRLSSGSFFKDL